MKEKSQLHKILNYLQLGYSISPIDALNMFGCFRLGARIFDLKQIGYDIAKQMVNGYAVYSLVIKENKFKNGE